MQKVQLKRLSYLSVKYSMVNRTKTSEAVWSRDSTCDLSRRISSPSAKALVGHNLQSSELVYWK
jgi:hypothetical protein